MASLSDYFGLGYRLDLTSQLATTYTEARTTFSLGNQTNLGTAGVITASGVAQFYAITNPTGSVLIEAGALKTGQPLIVDFSFTVDDFESGNPKVVPQGHDGQGASQRIRSRKRKDTKPEEFAGKKLTKAIEAVLAPPPVPVAEVTVEAPSPVLPSPETPQPPAQVEVVTEVKPIIYTPPSADVLESSKVISARQAEAADAILRAAQERKQAEAVRLAELARQQAIARFQAEQERAEEEARLQDEADATIALEAMLEEIDAQQEEEPEEEQASAKTSAPALTAKDIAEAMKEALADLIGQKPKQVKIIRGPDGRITGGTLS